MVATSQTQVPAGRTSRAQAQERTRRALLDAAREVVAQRGIAGASHEAIARQAGVTIGAIYSNFANKADLLAQLVADLSENGGKPFEAAPTLRACFTSLAHRLASETDLNPLSVDLSLEFMLYELRDGDLRERRLADRRREHQGHARVLEEIAASSGESLPMPALELVEVALGLAWSLSCSRRMLGPAVMTEDLMATALCLLLDADHRS